MKRGIRCRARRKDGSRKRRPASALSAAVALVIVASAFLAGCGGSSVLGVPIYPGAVKVDVSSTSMQPPGGNTGDNGQPPQMPTDDSGAPQNQGMNSSAPQPPGGNTGDGGQPPQPPAGDSGSNGQPPQMNGNAGGQSAMPGGGSTYRTSDSQEKVVTWYREQLSGETGFTEQKMQAPGRSSGSESQNSQSSPDQSSDSRSSTGQSPDSRSSTSQPSDSLSSTSESPVVFTFGSGTSTRTVMISRGDDGSTYITISDSSRGSSGESSGGATKATFTQDGGSASKTGRTYKATADDTSAVLVDNSGSLTVSRCKISTSGDSSSLDQSSFVGLNAAVLTKGGGTLKFSDGTITTTGSGANGAFAYGTGSSVKLSDVTIKATGQGGHAVMATGAGVLEFTDVDMTTAGANSGAIATDRGGGTIDGKGGTVKTTGQDSPDIYSTGTIRLSGMTMEATGAEAAVIEGSNSIELNDCSLASSVADKWGVMLYQSMSGDADGVKGVFTMTGGSLSCAASTGPLFFVTNSTGTVNLSGVEVNAASGVLLKAAGTDRWGSSGSNGGIASLNADGQALNGDLVADGISSINAALRNGSSLNGKINADNSAGGINLTLDATSTWNVTADSYITTLSDEGGISGTSVSNIVGNGHTVYYVSASCPALGGATYSLAGGGSLVPR